MFDTNPGSLLDDSGPGCLVSDVPDGDLFTNEDLAWLTGGDGSRERVGPEVAVMPPSWLGPFLDGVDLDGLGEAEVVRVAQAHARAVAHHQAGLLGAMTAVVDRYEKLDGASDLSEAMEGAVAELRAALQLTRRSAESDLDLGWRLRDRLPNVLGALRAGVICLRRARVLANGTDHLTGDEARSVCDQALQRAPSLTSGQLGALVRRLCVEIDPEEAADRYENARADRWVGMEPEPSGVATIAATGLAPDRATAIMSRLTRIARGLKTATEERTLDQLRSDVFCDLLEGNTTYGRSGVVEVRADIDTLARLDQNAVELGGYGPVVAELGRRAAALASRGEWRYVLTHRGRPVDVGTLRRRPTAAQRRAVEARDRTCAFPGCRMPAGGCDIDHVVPYAERPRTSTDQLAPVCRHDHIIRHRFQWRYRPDTDGNHIWFSPLGMQYTRPPPA